MASFVVAVPLLLSGCQKHRPVREVAEPMQQPYEPDPIWKTFYDKPPHEEIIALSNAYEEGRDTPIVLLTSHKKSDPCEPLFLNLYE